MWFGLGLVLVGILLLLNNLGIIKGDTWDYIWPAVIILVGLSMLFRRNDCCAPKVKVVKEDKKES
ncbi:MAG: hypothetical protein BWY19_00838 [bacterium ADurb.Bin212]|nr:MAG: hypothetical protein BWY19_00838 [bacterium ADurb.Bin212]